jgi:hypothetical protein
MNTSEKVVDVEIPAANERSGSIIDTKDLQRSQDDANSTAAKASTAKAKDALGDASRRLPASDSKLPPSGR